MLFVEGEACCSADQRYEHDADQFAANTLIPQTEYNAFVEAREYYPENFKEFAERLNIDVGIVVGRLQHDQHIKISWHNSLRKRYVWAPSYSIQMQYPFVLSASDSLIRKPGGVNPLRTRSRCASCERLR